MSVRKKSGQIREAVSLDEKRELGERQVAAIQMGHKLSCSKYWNEGPNSYLQDRRKSL